MISFVLQTSLLCEIVEVLQNAFFSGTCKRERCIWYNLSVLVTFSCDDRFQEDMVDRAEGFDIGADKEFWGEIKRGLSESLFLNVI